MYSIMEAVEAAQKRNAERDRLNQQRSILFPIAQPVTQPVMPTSYNDGGGDGPGYEDTRTEHQKYQDAVANNQWVGAVPVVGPIMGLMNDAFIEDYEAKNPDMVVGGGPSKFSTLGRVAGKGLTVEEQLAAKDAGLGLGKMLGFGDQKPTGGAQPGYTLMDRIFGTTPLNIAQHSDYIGVAPGMTGGGWETGGGGGGDGPAAAQGTSNFGGRESSIGMDDYSGYA